MAIKHVRVLGRNYKLTSGVSADFAGQCNVSKATIFLNEGMDAMETKDTLIHELFHAILHQQGRENGGEVEELYVRALATGFTAVLEDNPKLAAWIATPSKDS